ncbi:MAG: hypothetical protein ACTSYD_02290 [Candidatus Heimdallarchaeaceae archaeon]
MDEKSVEIIAEESRKILPALVEAIPDDATAIATVIALETLSKVFYKTYPELQDYKGRVTAIAESLSKTLKEKIKR